MTQDDKIAAIRLQFVPVATMLDSMTGSSIIQEWDSADIDLAAAFFSAGWI